MKTEEFFNLLNVDKVWAMDSKNVNSGYPVLAYQTGVPPVPGGPVVDVKEEEGIVPVAQEILSFSDVSATAWYYNAVAFVVGKGLFMGTSDDTFGPDITMTRAMLATVLYRMEGEAAISSAGNSNTFSDVAADAWYATAVAWVTANNIMNGYGNDLFGPGDNITRQQMAVVLFRYAQFKGYDISARADLSAYTDTGQIAEWALVSMQWANSAGFIAGITETTLNPEGNATRAQIATILMRFIKAFVETTRVTS